MLKVGLTGGIGSGKGLVAKMFIKRGALLIDADEVARGLMQPGTDVFENVVAHFGDGILNSDRSINRNALAETVFSNPQSLKDLNEFVHPAVIGKTDAWLQRLEKEGNHKIAVVSAPLLIEAGQVDTFDRIVVVACAEQRQLNRSMARGLSKEEALKRMNAQMPLASKLEYADYVINNDGTVEETELQVETIWNQLTKEADTSCENT